MNLPHLASIATVLCLAIGVPSSANGSPLPSAWHGVWSGRLTVHGKDGKTFERSMEIRIAPIAESQAVTWRITSTFGDKQTVRNYELVPDASKPGLFQLDEKNGILIDAKLMGQTLYSFFRDNDMLTTIKYERRGDALHMEMASVPLTHPRVSDLKAAGIRIESYELMTVQTGELKRVKQ